MRQWQRSEAKLLLCGGPCRGEIRKDAVFMVITDTSTAAKRIRCAKCAKHQYGEDAPTDLPEPEPFKVPPLKLPDFTLRPDFVRPREEG